MSEVIKKGQIIGFDVSTKLESPMICPEEGEFIGWKICLTKK